MYAQGSTQGHWRFPNHGIEQGALLSLHPLTRHAMQSATYRYHDTGQACMANMGCLSHRYHGMAATELCKAQAWLSCTVKP